MVSEVQYDEYYNSTTEGPENLWHSKNTRHCGQPRNTRPSQTQKQNQQQK